MGIALTIELAEAGRATARGGTRLPLLMQARLILRLVAREVPRSFRQFAVLIACIALGVGSIVSVIGLSRALNDGLVREGRVILGADAAFTLIQRQATEAEKAAIAAEGRLSQVTFSRAMALSAAGESALVEIKAGMQAIPPSACLSSRAATGRKDGRWPSFSPRIRRAFPVWSSIRC